MTFCHRHAYGKRFTIDIQCQKNMVIFYRLIKNQRLVHLTFVCLNVKRSGH